MASLPDDTLRKILMQIQSTAVNAQRQLQVVKQQSGGKDRERRIVQLTLRELDGMDSNVNVYKGVGKMFMQVPRPVMESDLKTQEKELTDDMTSLAKKGKYLEKQFNDAQGQLRDILHNAPRS